MTNAYRKPTHTGCYRCDICHTESEVYAVPVDCESCQNNLCIACAEQNGPIKEGDGRDSIDECLICASELLSAIRLACLKSFGPKVYRVAQRDAVRLTRQAVRDAIAAEWRENLKASAALTAPDTRIRHDGASWVDLDQRSNYTGD